MKRRRSKCANPLFEKWLEEWRQEAVQKNSTLQHSFAKALDSLRKYPLPLDAGTDCEILMHFGKKLCLMLDKKLKKHIELNNKPLSLQTHMSFEDEIERKKKHIDEIERKKKNIHESEREQQNINENNKCKLKVNKKQTQTSDKLYIPKIDSAAFAILITMYKNTLDQDYVGFMSKKDIINEAQFIINCPMKNSALQHYAGWNAMKTLMNKNLITKINKTYFSITNDGIALAKKLMIHQNSAEPSEQPDFSDEKFQNKKCSLSTSNESRSNDEKNIESRNKKATSLTDINVTLSEASKNSFTASKKTKGLVIISDEEDELQIKDIKNEDSPLIESKVLPDPDESFNRFCKANIETTKVVQKENQHFIFEELCNLSSSSTDSILLNCDINAHEVTDFDVNKKKSNDTRTEADRCINIVNTVSQTKQVTSLEDITVENFYLLPNNFDVILLVDSHETNGGKTKPKNDETISELSKLEIRFEIRSLKIGDFAWLARCRITNRELVLPYIVERKRIDDFGSSIKDGRYHEQKFRLRQSGIKNVIYLIESYGNNYYGSIPITTLFQAATNSLVQDDFAIKYTRDHKHSMRYLATLTNQITKIYESKELLSCTKINLESDNTEAYKDSLRMMEFKEFNKASVKTKNFKVQEMMIRQLLQIKGVSVEKAMVIAEKYPTPKILVNAFKNASDKLLANIEIGPKKQKLGPVLSKIIFQLYTLSSFN